MSPILHQALLGLGQDFDFFRANFDPANLDSGLQILETFLMSFLMFGTIFVRIFENF